MIEATIMEHDKFNHARRQDLVDATLDAVIARTADPAEQLGVLLAAAAGIARLHVGEDGAPRLVADILTLMFSAWPNRESLQ